MIVSRNGFRGWDTHACSGTVLIGSLKPAILASSELRPATHWMILPALTVPRVVSTPTALPLERTMPVTSVFWCNSTPRMVAPRA